jgi:exosortase
LSVREGLRAALPIHLRIPIPAFVAGVAFLLLFWHPIATLGRDWWTDPDAGHGLLLAPLAIALAWRKGRAPAARPQPVLGLALLLAAMLLRYVSGLAAELFTMRVSLLLGGLGFVVFFAGAAQARHWWLPEVLLFLSIPLPAIVLNSLSFPLQLRASRIGATMLHWRGVPVRLAGNVLVLPGHALFVTEACSGLRSLTALLAIGTLIGGLWLGRWWSRLALVLLAIPTAVLLNGVRVFLTGFSVYYISPRVGEGVMHFTEGWFMFMLAFGFLGALAWTLSRVERRRPFTPT